MNVVILQHKRVKALVNNRLFAKSQTFNYYKQDVAIKSNGVSLVDLQFFEGIAPVRSLKKQAATLNRYEKNFSVLLNFLQGDCNESFKK